uniref:RNA polymerase II elongation factor ELL N-terminal domain-containing protein n=1 Tax=Mycena chlorophos TaxID=658473 RepID=A0ABQ0M2V1_MYCCL|nr:predicted protein [Mycena chlorophos]
MSLPANVKLSLHRPPGEPNGGQKKAMIVRMSAETLDALQSNPRLQFAFTPNPEIIIGDKHFPMRPLKENSQHDLYLRAPSASKPLAPLKLYASITGKFTVERDLGTIQNEIRSSTQNAEKSRQGRTTVMLDAPPPDLSSSQNGRKRKVGTATAASRKPAARPAHVPTPIPVVPSSSSPTTIPATSAQRTAVVKALALRERLTFDELLRLMPSEDATSRHPTLQALLDQIGEKVAGKVPNVWRLKPNSWVEVRPWDWPDLGDNERVVLARTARLVFGNLNIPSSDPVWQHVEYRKTGESAGLLASAGPSRSDAAPKRGVSSKEVKEKKLKPKADPKAEIMVRDQTQPIAGPSNVKPEDRVRRGPGSGFRISKNTDADAPRGMTPLKHKPVREPPPAAPRQVEEKKIVQPRAKDDLDARDSLKRKKLDVDEASVAAKRRKTEPGRDLSLPKKPEPPAPAPRPSKVETPPTRDPRTSLKSKSDPAAAPSRSSLPSRAAPATSTAGRSHSESTTTVRSNHGQTKRRDRPSPVYTSSEDEADVPPPRKEAPLPTPPSTRRPLLHTDRDGLRASYKATYRKYLSSYQQLYAQQSKLESLLSDRDGRSDSEADIEVLTPEETMKLKADYKRWERELVNIRSMFERDSKSD